MHTYIHIHTHSYTHSIIIHIRDHMSNYDDMFKKTSTSRKDSGGWDRLVPVVTWMVAGMRPGMQPGTTNSMI